MGMGISVRLGEGFAEFVAEQVQSGRYASASEVVEDGLRQLGCCELEEWDAETLAYYRREVQKGLDDPVTIDGEEAFKMLDEVIASLESKQ